MNNNRIRLIIAEDHTLLLQGYLNFLSTVENISIVATASNYYDIINKLKNCPCDILLLDLSMPLSFNTSESRLSGLDILEFIKKEKIAVKTLVSSTHRDYEIIKKATSFGTKGYVFKNIDYPELLTALQVISNGKEYFQNEVKNIIISKKNDEGRLIAEGIKISIREKEILQLLSEGLKAEEIAVRLGLVRYTIEEYRTNLIRKFHAKNTTHLIKIASDYKFI